MPPSRRVPDDSCFFPPLITPASCAQLQRRQALQAARTASKPARQPKAKMQRQASESKFTEITEDKERYIEEDLAQRFQNKFFRPGTYDPDFCPELTIYLPSLPAPSPSSILFPGRDAKKSEVKVYFRAMLALYASLHPETTADSSAGPLLRQAGGMSSLPSFISVRPLAARVRNDVNEEAIGGVWFDGDKMRVLSHVRILKREFISLGFEEGVAKWMEGEIRKQVEAEGMEGLKRKAKFCKLQEFFQRLARGFY